MTSQLELTYVVDWDKDSPERTWSGTPYRLRKALDKYADVRDVSAIPKRSDFGIRVTRGISKRLSRYDLDLSLLRKQRAATKVDKDAPVLQFSEIVLPSEKQGSYIYQDLTVSYLDHLRKTDFRLFRDSGFDSAPAAALAKRRDYQNAYFSCNSGIFTMSKWLREYLVSQEHLPEAKVIYAGGGVSCPVEPLDISARKSNTLLFVGRDFTRKGGDLVLEAFRRLYQDNPALRLIICGPRENPAEGVAGVEYHGDVNSELLVKLYQTSDVFVMPSRFEAFGMVFPEALSYALPVIGRDAFEIPQFVRSGVNGILINDDNIGELAVAIDTCLTSAQIKNNCIDTYQQVRKDYSWDTVAQRIVTAMKDNGRSG